MDDDPAGGRVSPDPSDRDLLVRHVAGDPAAFATLVRRHQDRLWAVALRTLGDREEAADALQDALLSAYRAAGTFRGDAAVTTWLHRIVVNACVDRVRRRRSHPTVPLPPDDAVPATTDLLGERDLAADLVAALARLPEEQRVAIVLVDVEGYPVGEVAELLGVPAGTVKSRCARGRARLAGWLQDWRAQPGTGNPAVAAGVQQAPPTTKEVSPDGLGA